MDSLIPSIFTIGATIGVALLTGIWAEIRKLNSQLKDLAVSHSRDTSRIDSHDKLLDRLPCLTNNFCDRGYKK